MKQTLLKTLMYLFWLGALPAVGAAQQCINLIGESVTGNPGDTVVVNFQSLNMDGFVSLDFHLQWDTSVIQLHDQSTILPDGAGYLFGFDTTFPNRLSMIWVDLALTPHAYPDQSNLLTLRFIITGIAGQSSPISFYQKTAQGVNVYGTLDQELHFQGISGSVRVGAAANTLELFACSDTINCGAAGRLDITPSGGTPPYFYNWIGPNGFTSVEEDLTGIERGVYYLQVMDQSGQRLLATCYSDSIGVFPFEASLDLDCQTDSTLNATATVLNGGDQEYTFAWSNGMTLVDSTGTSLTDVADGAYQVTISNEQGCELIKESEDADCLYLSRAHCFTIKTPHQYLAPGSNCISVKADGLNYIDDVRFSMDWPGLVHFDSLGNFTPGLISANAVTLDSSEISNGKMGFSFSFNPDLVFDQEVHLFDICIDRSLFIEDLTTVSYGEHLPLAAQVSSKGGVLQGFNYANGVISLIPDTLPEFNEISGCSEVFSCSPIMAELDLSVDGAHPPFSFAWSGPDNFQASTEDIALQALSPGFYRVVISDSQGDSTVAGFEILQPRPADFGHYLDHVNCQGENTGAIETNYYHPNNELQYLWSFFDTTPNVGNLGAGSYTLTVTDLPGCETIADFVINEPSLLTADPSEVYCASPGQANGDIDLNISGGLFPYQVIWSDGDTIDSSKRYDLAAGVYEATISDAAGCMLPLTGLEIFTGGDFSLMDTAWVCPEDSIDLFVGIPAGAVITYMWPTDGLTCDPCTPPFFVSPTQPTAYEIRMDDGACEYLELAFVQPALECMWPGDTDTNKLVNHFDLLNIGLAHGSSGPFRPNASLQWLAQPGPSWNQSTPNSMVNYQHIDVDGNGLINDLDTAGISQNWGQMHDLIGDGPTRYAELPYALASNGGLPFYLQVDTLQENETYQLPVILGDAGTPATNVYGIAFSLTYDTEIIVPGSAHFSFENSWLGDKADLLYIQRPDLAEGRVDVAVTRTDGISMDGFGQLASFNITIEDDIFLQGGNQSEFSSGQEAIFEIRDVRAINFKEEEILISSQTSAATISPIKTGVRESWLESQVEIFPNPAQGYFQVQSGDLEIEEIKIFNATGQVIPDIVFEEASQVVDGEGLTEGVYWIKISTDQGLLVKRLVILK